MDILLHAGYGLTSTKRLRQLSKFRFVANLRSKFSVLFAFIGRDHPDRSAIRQKIRPKHKSYLGQVSGNIAIAGPLLSDKGEMLGSLLVIDFKDRKTAEGWIAGEPFTLAGLYQSMDIIAFENLWPQCAGFPPQNMAT